MSEVCVEVEPGHDVGRVAADEGVQCEQAAFDVGERSEHELILTNFLDPHVTAPADISKISK